MIIKSIKLENIRSYDEIEIKIPTGSVLLAGDIGAGKTTVLLAIDFALFGVRRGELSGSTLLRHGEEKGSVELNIEINDKPITVFRSLKRNTKKDTISQDSAYIEIDGNRESLSTVEIQTHIMKMLNYPIEFVKKNKSLIYRYTVYTPQETMKQILLTDIDDRLTILRKIFDIDKYKTVATNAQEVAKQLRSDLRELSGYVADLDSKKSDLHNKQQEFDKVSEDVKVLIGKVNNSKRLLDGKKKDKELLSKKVEEMNSLKQTIASLETELNSKKSRLTTVDLELTNVEKEFSLIPPKDEIEKLASKPVKMAMEQVDSEMMKLEKEKEDLLKDKTVSESDVGKWKGILEKGICNTCGQSVKDSTTFKNKITGMEMAIREIMERITLNSKKTEELKQIKENIYKFREEEQKKKTYLEQLERTEVKIKELKSEKSTLKKSLTQLEKDVDENKRKIDENISSKLNEMEKELEKLNSEYMQYSSEFSRSEQQMKDLENVITELNKEIQEKENKKKSIENMQMKENWLSNMFVSLMAIIEKHVMVQIHKEFNALFQKWFTTLIDNDEMTARIDNDFSIVVEQSGYETEYNNLSGGERTSVALAYRLALNAVINKIVEHIRTKDLLILDEPTDGFSTDQLEKVRDVLSELELKQIIIVSHEPKIESFVDNILRFTKENGITKTK